jgi:hypothetical protein
MYINHSHLHICICLPFVFPVEDPIFSTLYRELRYRQYVSNFTPTVQEMVEAHTIYCEVLDLLTTDKSIDLPKDWVFSIVYEFIKGYLAFHSLRLDPTILPGSDDAALLSANPHVWRYKEVFNRLQFAVSSSGLQDAFKKGLASPEGSRTHSALVSLG